MSIYQDDEKGASERLRKEAERDSELALERERLQKKEREEQHKNSLKIDLRKLESELHQKERELGAIQLETDHLAHITVLGKRASVPEEMTRAVEREKSEIRTLESSLTKAKEEESALDHKIATETRDASTSSESKLRTLERTLDEKEQTLRALESDIRDVRRNIATLEHGGSASDTERIVRDLQLKRETIVREEKLATEALTRHKRELELHEREIQQAQTGARAEEDRGRTAELRMREQDTRKRELARAIEEIKRHIENIQRDLH